MFVEETGEHFTSIGQTRPEISDRLGWRQGNIWLPEAARQYIEVNHPEFIAPIRAIERILTVPLAVHDVPEEPNQIQFFAEVSHLRREGIIVSRSMRTADVLIELRNINGEVYLRAFHLSPMRRPKEGRQRWP